MSDMGSTVSLGGYRMTDRVGIIGRSVVREATTGIGTIIAFPQRYMDLGLTREEIAALGALKHVLEWNHSVVIEKDD
jgi:hypothetical protein